MAEVGLRVNETRHLDLADIKWDLGRFGKLHVRHGKGAGRTLRWFVEDVWCHLGDDPLRLCAPLFCSERRNADGTAARVGSEALRACLAEASAKHLPEWPDSPTPHVLRHFCASQLYLGGMDLIAIQETLGHAWIAATMKMSGLWSGNQASVKLDDLDVICAVLGCGIEEVLIPELDKVKRPGQATETKTGTGGLVVTPKRRDRRSLPPV